MADKQFDLLRSFRDFIQAIEGGEPVPPVSQEHLKHMSKMHLYLTKWHSGSDGTISMGLMASVCGPKTNLPAVWFRHTQLRLPVRDGALAEWQHSADLDDTVYQVAATIQMNGLHFDQKEFIQQLRLKAVA